MKINCEECGIPVHVKIEGTARVHGVVCGPCSKRKMEDAKGQRDGRSWRSDA